MKHGRRHNRLKEKVYRERWRDFYEPPVVGPRPTAQARALPPRGKRPGRRGRR